jgi:hypothetical protein
MKSGMIRRDNPDVKGERRKELKDRFRPSIERRQRRPAGPDRSDEDAARNADQEQDARRALHGIQDRDAETGKHGRHQDGDRRGSASTPGVRLPPLSGITSFP